MSSHSLSLKVRFMLQMLAVKEVEGRSSPLRTGFEHKIAAQTDVKTRNLKMALANT